MIFWHTLHKHSRCFSKMCTGFSTLISVLENTPKSMSSWITLALTFWCLHDKYVSCFQIIIRYQLSTNHAITGTPVFSISFIIPSTGFLLFFLATATKLMSCKIPDKTSRILNYLVIIEGKQQLLIAFSGDVVC